MNFSIDPTHMAIINLALIILLATGVVVYRYIYPKKKINLFVFLVLISIIPILSIFRPGTYESGDFNIHIYRSMSFYASLQEGNIMPSWAGELNATYGYPLFIFNYTLPYYIISFFHFLGFSFLFSLKIFLAGNFILSGIFMYLFSKQIYKHELPAFLAGIFYLFFPYHLISLNFKVTIGEILFYTITPITFIFLEKYIITKKTLYLLLLSLSISGAILSHAFLALFVILILIIYSLLRIARDTKKFLSILGGITLGIMIASYNLIPLLIYRQYLFISKIEITTVYFPKFEELLFSPFRWGFLFQGPKGELSYLIGYSHMLILAIGLFVWFRYKKFKKNIIYTFWIFLSITLIFLILPISKFIWELMGDLKIIGSHRLMIPLGFSLSIMSTYFYLIFKKRKILLYFVILFTIYATVLNWSHRRLIPQIYDATLKENLPYSTSQGEAHFYANTAWVNPKNPWQNKVPKNNLEIIDGSGEVRSLMRTSTKHVYLVNSKQRIKLKENTLYFPGWTSTSNGKKIEIYPDSRGIINLDLNPGKQIVEFSYKDIFLYSFIKNISYVSLILLVITILLFLLRKKYK